MITALIYPLLERAINRCLQTDLQALAALQSLDDKVIQLQITDWRFDCFIIPKHNGIELQPQWMQAPDTTISGTLEHLLKVGVATDKATAMKQHKIQFQGDIHVGMTMQQLLSQLDIDWTGLLADRIGDNPAQLITIQIGKLRQQGRAMIDSLRQNTHDYVHHEVQLAPTSSDLEAFYQAVTKLRNDVDRLEAKITLQNRPPSE